MAFLSQNALFTVLRMAGLASAFLALVFVVNNFLIFGIDAPGVINTLRLNDIFGVDRPKQGYNISQILLGIVQTGFVGVVIAYTTWRGLKPNNLRIDANWMDDMSAYIVRLAFWAVLLVRVFALDVTICPASGGRLHLTAASTDPASVRRYLSGVGLPSQHSLLTPPRPPPQAEWDFAA